MQDICNNHHSLLMYIFFRFSSVYAPMTSADSNGDSIYLANIPGKPKINNVPSQQCHQRYRLFLTS